MLSRYNLQRGIQITQTNEKLPTVASDYVVATGRKYTTVGSVYITRNLPKLNWEKRKYQEMKFLRCFAGMRRTISTQWTDFWKAFCIKTQLFQLTQV